MDEWDMPKAVTASPFDWDKTLSTGILSVIFIRFIQLFFGIVVIIGRILVVVWRVLAVVACILAVVWPILILVIGIIQAVVVFRRTASEFPIILVIIMGYRRNCRCLLYTSDAADE